MSDTAALTRSLQDDLVLNEEKNGNGDNTTAISNTGNIDDVEDEEFSLSLDKKKKKKKKKPKDIVEDVPSSAPISSTDSSINKDSNNKDGDVDNVIGALSNDSDDYNYTELLDRVFTLLQEKNPSLGSRKRYSMPPPQLIRVGTRKTVWSNFSAICTLMHRQPEHVMSFLLAELGTDGSIDGSQRMMIKGRYQQKQVESLLRKYITEYVTCHMCQKPETSLTRDSVTRLYFVNCESCGSRRSVAPIKSGFHATMRAERRKANEQ